MRFVFGKQDMAGLEQAQNSCWLMTNGLGGYASMSAAYSASRGDQGLLIAAKVAPSLRYTLVHRMSECILLGDKEIWLSTQEFGDGTAPEDGYRHLSSFLWEQMPIWHYEVSGISVCREYVMAHGENTCALLYRLTNTTDTAAELRLFPAFLCAVKGAPRRSNAKVAFDGEKVTCAGVDVYLHTDGALEALPVKWEKLYYRDDAPDGRRSTNHAFTCCSIRLTVLSGQTAELSVAFSDRPVVKSEVEIRENCLAHLRSLSNPFRDPVARELTRAADAYISRRDSTGGDTIIAGFPFFGDWGRDTMIALPGCVLETGHYDTALSILRTFLAYEKDGLVPNLFPEGGAEPRYNTVDAALLLINSIWLYYEKTSDTAFVREAFPVLRRIIDCYIWGTHHGIHMDTDGLICAGEGLDQVTWMDVCVDGILPTPRHGKPVEINAYWYNALKILEALSPVAGEDGSGYGMLAEKTKASFLEKFLMPEAGCLKDVLSGTRADTQIRCNQIWAVTMPFTMLNPQWERRVVDTVYRELYTPCGLRTLSPGDPEFHPTYGGPMKQRDLAYHQGTVWVFPLGAWYRAYLKVNGFSKTAAARVREMLAGMVSMLREGCVGQLPEIYDGLTPGPSRGCFAQAWSVGEMLTVYALLEKIENQ